MQCPEDFPNTTAILPLSRVSVIPNAVNGDKFTPDPSMRPRDRCV